jgi:hypothetical protein
VHNTFSPKVIVFAWDHLLDLRAMQLLEPFF